VIDHVTSKFLSRYTFFEDFHSPSEATYAHNAIVAQKANKKDREKKRKKERAKRNGSTVICGGRKVDSGVRTAQLSADENEL